MNTITGKQLRFLADANVERDIITRIAVLGYDIQWVPTAHISLDDETILRLAEKEGRILITNDKDFGELIFRQKRVSAGIVLIRIKGATGKQKAEIIGKLVTIYGNKLRGNFVVVTARKCRFLPIGGWS
ncbi:MAG: DUF5615 family PIN-like protein [Bacillota bacterium]